MRSLFERADVIVDALLGIGSRGPVQEPLSTCVLMANASEAKIIAADVPTRGMRADRICAFHRAKTEGSTVVDIGIPLEAECYTGPGDLTLLPSREHKAHKGAGGEVLVIGGGPYQGAPWLAGLGALRAGADIVRIASPVFEPIPDLIYERLAGERIGEEHIERLIALAEHADVVVCGNGLGTESHQVVREVIPCCKKAVFDADALRLPLPLAAGETIYHPACRGICPYYRNTTARRIPGTCTGGQECRYQRYCSSQRTNRYHNRWKQGTVQPDGRSGDDGRRYRRCACGDCRCTALPPPRIRGGLHCRICQWQGRAGSCGRAGGGDARLRSC